VGFTIEENKEIQRDVGVRYIDKQVVKLYLRIYKLGVLKDNKEMSFHNKEACMIHVENLIKTTDYNLHGFSSEPKNGSFPERYFITLRK